MNPTPPAEPAPTFEIEFTRNARTYESTVVRVAAPTESEAQRLAWALVHDLPDNAWREDEPRSVQTLEIWKVSPSAPAAPGAEGGSAEKAPLTPPL